MQQGNRTVDWTPDRQVAFDTLKTALVSAPVLAYADFSKPFHLYSDASLGGLGAILAQVQDSRERVIVYASRSLHPTERNDKNYSSFKLEFLALKWAVTEKFKDYLWGNKFLAFTDNNPLVHLDKAHLGATEQCWAAQLANFDFELKYRSGIANRNADLLSRLPQETIPTQQAEMVPAQQAQVSAVELDTAPDVGNEWRDWQEEEPALVQVKEWVTEGHPLRPEERKMSLPVVRRHLREWSRLHIQEGVLKCRVLERHTRLSLSKIMVPMSKTHELWEKYHNTSGHMGVAKMEALLRKAFYWQDMTTNLQEWASKCVSCVQQKRGPEVRGKGIKCE